MMDFTVEEMNLISIYITEERIETAEALRAALPFVDDAEMKRLMIQVVGRLHCMSDEVFRMTCFAAVEPDV